MRRYRLRATAAAVVLLFGMSTAADTATAATHAKTRSLTSRSADRTLRSTRAARQSALAPTHSRSLIWLRMLHRLSATPPAAFSARGLDDPREKEIAMELVSSAENSTLNWRAEYGYIQDIGDGRGYTGGIIGFTSGTGDMLEVVTNYTNSEPNNPLAPYLPALRSVNGTDSHAGLGTPYIQAWQQAATDPVFQATQDEERDRVYFNPAVQQAKADGLGTLGQFIYYDAMMTHGPGDDPQSFGGLRTAAMARAKTPAQGGSEVRYLNTFLDVRRAVMAANPTWAQALDRIDTEQRVFLNEGNLQLLPPLAWSTYGDQYQIKA